MEINTHEKIDRELCGKPLEVGEGFSKVAMKATANMAADQTGLVHGGFLFGQADYAAMIAVNHPNVVLGGADVKFLKPVKTGQEVVAEANVTSVKGKKNTVQVVVKRVDEIVFEGIFYCFVLDSHVLSK